MSSSAATSMVELFRSSQDRYAALLGSLDESAVTGPSYDDDWTIADVASHLGSQAEIFDLVVDAGRSGGAGPGPETFQPIWDRWNAKTPAAQVADSVAANDAFAARLESMSEDERESFAVSLFGMDLDLAGVIKMRLGEHALHAWDVAVAVDPSAVIPADAVAVLVDGLDRMAGRGGRATDEARSVTIETSDPRRTFVVTTGPGEVSLAPRADGDDDRGADLRLPAEALVRLVAGRLDPEHTPDSVTDDEALTLLRPVFPGF